jgi:hypothetical protein
MFIDEVCFQVDPSSKCSWAEGAVMVLAVVADKLVIAEPTGSSGSVHAVIAMKNGLVVSVHARLMEC